MHSLSAQQSECDYISEFQATLKNLS